MELDLAIRGGTVVTASDTIRCDVGIAGERIVVLGENLSAAREIDARGLLVLPGGIDSHVHIAQPSGPGVEMADDFASATASAAAGGNTMVLPFALQERGRSLRECVEEYRRKAVNECYVDTAFHLIVSDPTPEVLGQELPALLKDGYTSFKVFMTYDELVLNDRQLLDVFDVARNEGALVMVHAEGYDAIRFMTERLERAGKTAPYYHAVSREGSIGVGFDADIMLWDPNRQEIIRQEVLHHGADYTPWEGFAVTGWPVMTLARGRVAAEEGRIVGEKGFGHILGREISAYASRPVGNTG